MSEAPVLYLDDFEQSPTIAALATALAIAQGEIENASKDSTNPHFNSKYADLASVRAAAKPIYGHGLAIVQQVASKPDGSIGVRTVLTHKSGEWMASRAYVKPDKSGPQAAGSVVTYLRRYMLAAALGIAQEDDDANAATTIRVPRPAPPASKSVGPAPMVPLVGAQDGDQVRGLLLRHGPEGMGWEPKHAERWLQKYFGVKRPADLKPPQAVDAALLLTCRMKTPELYPSRLEQFHSEKRVLTAEVSQ